MSQSTDVYVCKGSRCAKRKRERAELVATLEGLAKVHTVGCQKVCNGPVAGVEVDGRLEWFSELGSDKARRRLAKLVRKGKMSKTLEKRRCKKRSGKRC